MKNFSEILIEGKSGGVKKVGKYWVDKNGNKWDVKNYNEKEAEKASKSLKGCKNCIDCEKCDGCDECKNCGSCKE